MRPPCRQRRPSVAVVAMWAWAWACLGMAVSRVEAQPAPDPAATAASAPAVIFPATSDEPRAFGWRVGDIVRRNVSVEAAPGWTLDPASLPPLGRHGTALELRAMRSSSHRHLDGGHRIDLRLDYQIFIAPKEVRTFELPELRIGFTGKAGGAQGRVSPWPVVVSPLTADDPPSRDGLGAYRPDAGVPRIATASARQRLWWWGFGLVLGAAYLLHVYVGLPWSGSRRRPFAAAWRDVRRAAAGHSASAVPDAYRAVHGGLNQAAHGVLFARGVEPFVASAPAFAPLRDDLLAFFERSRAVFFAANPAVASAGDSAEQLRWLLALSRRLRDAERGSA